ncbi:MAG: ThiF family adenylyltransferase [Candidatus Kinetoplastibacterium crithidii]|nr:MAG: ThiF family adenylyltransferase [Candidatus Kinetoplastibacterium crithidii]
MKENIDVNLTRRFSGVVRLYNEKLFDFFRNSHVAVIGVGGVGSWAVEALARTGVGNITMVDLDNISESNINRQIHALSSTIGKTKIFTMAERILEINPSCHIVCKEEFITSDNINSILSDEYNIIIDCIDQVASKLAIVFFSMSKKIPLLLCGAAGGKTDPFSLKYGDISLAKYDSLLSSLRYKIRKDSRFLNLLKNSCSSNRFPRKFGLNALWFEQHTVYPNNCSKTDFQHGLACSGYGSIVTSTASMGFAASSIAISIIEEEFCIKNSS